MEKEIKFGYIKLSSQQYTWKIDMNTIQNQNGLIGFTRYHKGGFTTQNFAGIPGIEFISEKVDKDSIIEE